MIGLIWAVIAVAFGIEALLLVLLRRKAGQRVFFTILLSPAIVWWITSEQDLLERVLSSLFFPFTLAMLTLKSMSFAFWPLLLTIAALGVLAFSTVPQTPWKIAPWFLVFTALCAEVPLLTQDAWSRPMALHKAEELGLENIEVPHFRQSLRNHLGDARNWLNNSNGRGYLDGELYLWSYRKSEWYIYDPNWWR